MAQIEDVTYEIVGVDATLLSISVKFKTANAPDGLIFLLDLPIADDNTVPTGDDLDAFIRQHIPLEQLTYAETEYAWTQDRKARAALVPSELIPSINQRQISVPVVGAQEF